MSLKRIMYKISCPLCKMQIIESSETDSKLKCVCGASYDIWIHEDIICIRQNGVSEEQKAVQTSKAKKYSEFFNEEK